MSEGLLPSELPMLSEWRCKPTLQALTAGLDDNHIPYKDIDSTKAADEESQGAKSVYWMDEAVPGLIFSLTKAPSGSIVTARADVFDYNAPSSQGLDKDETSPRPGTGAKASSEKDDDTYGAKTDDDKETTESVDGADSGCKPIPPAAAPRLGSWVSFFKDEYTKSASQHVTVMDMAWCTRQLAAEILALDRQWLGERRGATLDPRQKEYLKGVQGGSLLVMASKAHEAWFPDDKTEDDLTV